MRTSALFSAKRLWIFRNYNGSAQTRVAIFRDFMRTSFMDDLLMFNALAFQNIQRGCLFTVTVTCFNLETSISGVASALWMKVFLVHSG